MTTPTPIEQMQQLRDRVLELLRQEGRALHTGDIAVRLRVPTNEVHVAMHQPLQRREVSFVSSDGWFIPPRDRQHADHRGQARID